MPYLPNAIQPHLQNCNLYDINGGINVNVNGTYSVLNDALLVQQGIAILYNNIAIAAMHNFQARFPQPRCYPETRVAILDHITQWIEERVDGDRNKRILWIHGAAGAGKSAIARTIVERFAQRQALIASFFFTRGNDRRGAVNYVIATIAYQLANSVPEMREDIAIAIAKDPSILNLELGIQIERLIVVPFLSFLSRPNAQRPNRCLIIIDGLDECDGDHNQSMVISLIGNLFHHHNFPFIFILASRPEPHIRNSFRNDPRVAAITQEFELNPSPEDICTFLLTSFQEICTSHPALISRRCNEQWPSQKDIDTLVY